MANSSNRSLTVTARKLMDHAIALPVTLKPKRLQRVEPCIASIWPD